MNSNDKKEFKLNHKDIIKNYIRSSGKGGQNVNKVSSCVQLTHIPTGIQVKVQDTRDQYKNEEIAYQRLYDKLKSIEDQKFYDDRLQNRKNQIGSGKRGENKRRTYRLKEDMVVDHFTGKNCRWSDILKGKIELLNNEKSLES